VKKKIIRIVLVLRPEILETTYQIFRLIFGRANVSATNDPTAITTLLLKTHPTTLILDPSLCKEFDVPPKEINVFRSKMHYHLLTVYPDEETAAATRGEYRKLFEEKEYFYGFDAFSMAKEIPALSKNKVVPRRKILAKKTQDNLDRIFTECGFHCNAKGCAFLKECLFRMYYDPDLHRKGGAVKLYRELAEKYGTTPRIVERSILRFLESSWSAQTEAALRKELRIPAYRSFVPINFGRFTEIFNTYYTIKYGTPEANIRTPAKERYY